MNSGFILLFLVVSVCAYDEFDYKQTFTEWMKTHNKMYSANEFRKRFIAFRNNMDFVRDWNAANSETKVGLNHLADLSNEEYQNLYLGTRFDASVDVRSEAELHLEDEMVAADVDWRTRGVVTGVKDQGRCGGCWSFSATGSVEAQHALSKGTLVSLSEQNLIDCSTSYGNAGCSGGMMDKAFRYIIGNNGIDTEASYGYNAANGPCHFDASKIGATISGYKDIPTGSETALANAAATVGPISVAIDASHSSFQLYKSGVYYESQCSSSKLDHGVLVVGYGTQGTSDYWIVKNSWGISYGQQGYLMMSRNRNNNCGIATVASYPVV